jgi:RimJ/RimL family protein N-acetyltransferase
MIHFDFSHNYILENDRVLLRPLLTTDFENLFDFSLNEPDIWKYSLIKANGADNLKLYIELAIAARNSEKEYPFIVFDKHLNQYAGSTRFYDIQISQETLQLGYTWYGKQFQGTGLNKNCKFLLLEFAFETLGMERVEFRADNNNARSIAAMKSIGCKVEGVLRNNGKTSDGLRRDSIVLSILKSEWFENVKENLRARIKNSL